MGVSKYFVPMSDERRMQHLARESEQAREDITNLQRQMDRPVGDIAPSGAGDGSEGFPLFIYGALTDTLQRGGDATLDAGGESDYDVVDSNDGLPGSITLPIGANLWARRHANEYHVIPPPWAFTLPNCTLPGGGIAYRVGMTDPRPPITAAAAKPSSEPPRGRACALMRT